MIYRFVLITFAVLLAACSAQKPTPVFHAADNPAALSEWGVLALSGDRLELGQGVIPYDLNTPLFTDYAHKLRTIWMPEGMSASYREGDVLDFPVGTVISKTFYYPSDGDAVLKRDDLQPVSGAKGLDLRTHRLIETRLLVRRAAGWEPVSYVWNAAQTEAKLTRIGAIVKLTLHESAAETPFAYAVPNINQCAGCHAPNNTTKLMTPIGPKPRYLNRDYNYGGGAMNQLDKLTEAGFLTGSVAEPPKAAIWDDTALSVDARARAYLDMNCAHCHNPAGPADTSGLHLNIENDSAPHLGICKNAVAAGGGTGGRKYDITPGRPDQSITTYRMASTDPGAMMPELGRSLTHKEGVALIEEWIAAMDSVCDQPRAEPQ